VRELFRFPNPVNEISARVVAAGVVIMALITIAFDVRWLTAVIAYGFLARVLTGPTLSPLGQLVTRVITPSLQRPAKLVPGPPKRFAQGIGAVLSTTAAVLVLGFGQVGAGYLVLGLVVFAATLESVFAYCLGCTVFGWLMRLGVIPEKICVECNDIWARQRAATS
jgi:hypothetical protein